MVNNTLDTASFSLVRTDARLTGNIKITVDSNNDIWLNTIDGNSILSNDIYKHRAIIDGWSHPMNVAKFVGSNNDDAVKHFFDVRQDVDPNTIASNYEYEKQYDFSEYFAGAKYLKSRSYSEKISYFAPFYLNGEDIPEYFVIMKIDGAINGSLDYIIKNKDSVYDKKNYMYELINRSTIIKTFDLGPSTRIGKYLRNMITDNNYPQCGLSVNFNEGMFTNWCGVDIVNGVYSEAGELLYDFYTSRKPLTVFEKYITDGFKRHSLLHPNIINLEFLFDDETSDIFDHNRYFGVYVNSIEYGMLTLNHYAQKDMSFDTDDSRYDDTKNYPKICSNINPYICNYVTINNNSGVKLSVNPNSYSISDLPNLVPSVDNQIISYLRDKNGDLHRIKNIAFDNKYGISQLTLDRKSIDYCDYVGSTGLVSINDYGIVAESYQKSYVYFKFNEIPIAGDTIKIYHANGTYIDGNKRRYDKIVFTDTFGSKKFLCGDYYTSVNVTRTCEDSEVQNEFIYSGEYYNGMTVSEISDVLTSPYMYLESEVEIDILPVDGTVIYDDTEKHNAIYRADETKFIVTDRANLYKHNYFYVGVVGGKQHMDKFTSALAKCINTFLNAPFIAYGHKNEFMLVTSARGDFDKSFAVSFELNDYSYIDVLGDDVDGVYYSSGGSHNKYTLLIDDKYADEVSNVNCVKINGGYSKITKIGKPSYQFTWSMSDSEIERAFDLFNNYLMLEYTDDVPAAISDENFYISNEFYLRFGLMSFYRIKDFDFDTFSTKYSKGTYWDKYKYSVPEGVQYINPYYIYLVDANSITAPGCIVVSLDDKNRYAIFVPEDGDYSKLYSYTSADQNNPVSYITPYCYILCGDKISLDTGLIDFDNFTVNVSYAREKYGKDKDVKIIYFNDEDEYYDSINPVYGSVLNGGIQNEYDYYNENYYASDSEIPDRQGALVQYSCKWGMKNGYDSFGNPYRLNTNDAFGANNLTPSRDNISVDFSSYTNNWMYLVSNIYNSDDNYCYINKPFVIDNKFNFKDYFTIFKNGTYKYFYSTIKYNSVTGKCETFFRGEKLVFTTYDSNGVAVENDMSYDGYLFSAIIVPCKKEKSDTVESPVTYVIKKDDSQKYVLFYVNVYLEDNTTLNLEYMNLSRSVIYPYNFKFCGFFENDPKDFYLPQFGFVVFDKDYDNGSFKLSGDYVIDGDTNNIAAGSILYCIGNQGDEYSEEISNIIYYGGGSGSGGSSGGGSYVPEETKYVNTDEFTVSYYRIITPDELMSSRTDSINRFYSILTEYPYSIDADYRIHFDENGLCSLTYSDFYTYKSKKFRKDHAEYSTVTYPFILNYPYKGEKSIVKSVAPNYKLSVYDSMNSFDISTPHIVEYKKYEGGEEKVKYDFVSTVLRVASKSGNFIYVPIPRNVYKSADISNAYTTYGDDDPENKLSILRLLNTENNSFDISRSNKQSLIHQVCGGYDYFRNNVFKRLSFGYIRNIIENNYDVIINDNCSNMRISFNETSLIKTKNYMNIIEKYNEDGSTYGFTYDITENATDTSIPNISYLKRYSGQYDMIFNDVITFGSGEGNNYNVYFNSNYDNFGTIEHFPHLKVLSNPSILSTNEHIDSNYSGNNTVGYADMDILRTSWDLDFHKLYTSKDEYVDIPGTKRVEEDDTYINNIIILPDSITLTDFDVQKVDDVDVVKMDDKQLVYSVDKKTVNVRINYRNVIINKLIEMGISKAFDDIKLSGLKSIDYLGLDIDTYIRSYINKNIIGLYEISSMNVYYKNDNKRSKFGISSSIDMDMIYNYKTDNNVLIKNNGDYVIDFVYTIKDNYNPVINFVIDMKLI